MVNLPEPFAKASNSYHQKLSGEAYSVAHERPVYADFQMVAYAGEVSKELRRTCRQLHAVLSNLCSLREDGISQSDDECAEAFWDLAYKVLASTKEVIK